MLFTKYLLLIIGFGLLVAAAAILIYDVYAVIRKARSPGTVDEPQRPVRVRQSAQLAGIGFLCILLGLSIVVIPGGYAGVRISQFSGTLPGTLYPGVHWNLPLAEHVELFDTRDHIFSTSLPDEAKKKGEPLRVQTKEGLGVGLAITVRYRLDPSKL